MELDTVVEPLTQQSVAALACGEHAVLGISPFNSYFSEERIGALAAWGLSNFKRLNLFVPDEPTRYTLEALGYSEVRARKKARKQCNWLHNKIRKALAGLGVAGDAAETMVVGWAELSSRPAYLELYGACLDRFAHDSAFRDACLESASWALADQVEERLDSSALETASRYFLAEIPLFVDSARVFGVSASVFCYHRVIPFLTRLFAGELPMEPVTTQGFVRVEVKEWPGSG